MPEVGNMGLSAKLLAKGITDMVRISDGRMRGTGFRTVVLYVSPEAADGGTLGIMQDGDEITLPVYNRKLQLNMPNKEIAERKKNKTGSEPVEKRGYIKLYQQHVGGTHLGLIWIFARELRQ